MDQDCANSGKHHSDTNPLSVRTSHRSVKAYLDLLAASPTTHPNHPLLAISARGNTTVVTIPMLARVFSILLEALHLDPGFYPLHNLRRGNATAAYWGGSDNIDVKRDRLSASNTFWLYLTSPYVAASLITATLAKYSCIKMFSVKMQYSMVTTWSLFTRLILWWTSQIMCTTCTEQLHQGCRLIMNSFLKYDMSS